MRLEYLILLGLFAVIDLTDSTVQDSEEESVESIISQSSTLL